MYLPEERLAGVGIFAPPPGTGLLGTLLPRSLAPVRVTPPVLGTAPARRSRGKPNGLHFRRKTDLAIHLWYLAILWMGCCAIGLSITSPSRAAFSYYLSLAWSIYFPVAAVGFVGAVVAEASAGLVGNVRLARKQSTSRSSSWCPPSLTERTSLL